MSKQYVFDSSAIISIIKSEEGNKQAEALIDSSILSVISVSEIINVLCKGGMEFELAREIVGEITPNIAECSYEDAIFAAKIKAENPRLGLSLGDSVCLALAYRKKCPVATADKTWEKLDKTQFEVICIR